MDFTPTNGFLNFIQEHNASAVVGQSSTQPAFCPPQPTYPFAHGQFPAFCTQPPPPATENPSAGSRSGRRHRVRAEPEVEIIDDGRGRLYYTNEEDLRLVSAWLNNSTDPIQGNARKGDTYWKQVTTTYNSTTPDDRKREMSQLKSHWHKTTKKVNVFNGCYIQLKKEHTSGRSEKQLMDQTMALYHSRQGQHFTFTHWWEAVRFAPKWNVHVGSLGPRKATPDLNAVPTEAPTPMEPTSAMPRPIGVKRAKKGKEGVVGSAEIAEMVKSLVDAKASDKEEIGGIMEFQQRLADQKVEAANLALMAAQEKKKSKMIEHKNKLLDKLSEMLAVDTSSMEPWRKELHMKATTQISDQLWGKEDIDDDE